MANEDTYLRKDAAYWKTVFETAAKRLAELRAERDSLDATSEALSREIVRFESLITSLNPITSDSTGLLMVVPTVEGVHGLGLADACREILRQGTSYRTARGIRDSLAASGYDLQQHSNALASIHGVLKRLVESGDVEMLESDGKTRYRWRDRGVTGSVRLKLPSEEDAAWELNERKRAEARAAMANAKKTDYGIERPKKKD